MLFIMENEDRVLNMQEELILEKTEEFLSNISCSPETKEQLSKMISTLVSHKQHLRVSNFPIYVALKKVFNKSERTNYSRAKEAIEDIILDDQTRETLKKIGIRRNIKTASFLKAAVKEIEKNVTEEKKKGCWIG
ncbi:MAG: hypothetical protein MJB12_02305 [Firmicutes bacterium]|nr:hypothetical protein [Bacillota bacterium]